MANLVKAFQEWGLGVFGVRVDVGGGKTEALINCALSSLADKGGPVVVAVPNLTLADEVADRFRRSAKQRGKPVTVQVWRGRSADDPNRPGKQMCDDLEAVDAALAASERVLTACCEYIDDEKRLTCKNRFSCGYMRQRGSKVDVWIITHALLAFMRPDAIPHPQLLAIDESFWQALAVGFSEVLAIPVDQLLTEPVIRKTKGRDRGDWHVDKMNDLIALLMPIRRLLHEAIRLNGYGPLKRECLESVGLIDREICRDAPSAELSRLSSVMYPGMPAQDRMAQRDKWQSRVPSPSLMADIWWELTLFLSGGKASGRLSVEPMPDGQPGMRLVLRTIRPIHRSWLGAVAHIDATLRPKIVHKVLPFLDLRADIQIETPFQRIVAVTGKSTSRSALGDEAAARDFGNAVLARATLVPGRTLVVTTKAMAHAWQKQFPNWPKHIPVLHHGAVVGLDGFKDVRLMIIIGRNLPPPWVIEQYAGALSGEAVTPCAEWFSEGQVTVVAADGTRASFKKEWHPDPLAEEVRASIAEDGTLQEIGRARGLNRTEKDPVTIELWGDTLPLLPVDSIRPFEWASKDEIALGYGLWVESAADLAKIAPELGSEKAIKSDRERRTASVSYRDIHTKTRPSSPNSDLPDFAAAVLDAAPHLCAARYQRAGAGTKPKVVVWNPAIVSEIKALLSERLGPLVRFELLEAANAGLDFREAAPKA
jgi:hypothetical protein